METHLAPFTSRVYALLRIFSGWMFAFHGVQKIFGVLTDQPMPSVGSQTWIGGMIELVCGALIAIGLFTRPAAFLASGTMAVAYFQFHWKFRVDQNFWPGVNMGELAVVYCFLFLYISCRGNGPWSVGKERD